MQLLQIARLASKSEVQDPEVHVHCQPFIPCTVQGPIVTSAARESRVVEGGVSNCDEGEGRVVESGVNNVEVGGFMNCLKSQAFSLPTAA